MTITSPEMERQRKVANDRDVEFVKLGYAGSSLDFRVQVDDADTFRRCVEAIGGYNRFSATEVNRVIGRILPELMRVDVGRECSPVLYLYVPFCTQQRMTQDGPNEHIPDEDREALAQRIRDLGKKLHADEIHDQDFEGKPYCIRLWWD